jgi:hypothetical protein
MPTKKAMPPPTADTILTNALALLDKVQEANPNSKRYSLLTEQCEAEFRDVLRLAPGHVPAALGLSNLFLEHFTEAAISILKSLGKIKTARSPAPSRHMNEPSPNFVKVNRSGIG